MTEAASRILDAFDALPVDDRRHVVAALLRRVVDEAPPDLTDDSLLATAEALFLELDAEEVPFGNTQSR